MFSYRSIYTLLLITFIFVSGCKKFDKEEAIPVYIKINQSFLLCDSVSQGSSRHNLSDVWVNLDGNQQGIYELPVTFPVIAEENHQIEIRPGIKVNGIGASRMAYPFLNIFKIDTFFTPGNIMEIAPVYTYNSNTVFKWLENFQNNGFTLDRMTDSDTTLEITVDSVNPQQHYGEFHIDAVRKNFQYKSAEAYNTSTVGSTVFFEFDYQSDHPMYVGLVINKIQQSVETVLIVLNPHPQSFNHIYVDIGSTLLQNPDAVDFNIVFGASLDEAEGYTTGNGKIDNIKLLHF